MFKILPMTDYNVATEKDWQGPPEIVSDWSYDFSRLIEIGIDYQRPPEIVSDWSYDLNRLLAILESYPVLSSLN